MVIIIDDCRECRFHFTHYGTVVLCSHGGATTARHVFEATWGPVFVSNCPLARAAELYDDSGDPDDTGED
jgi:hypothetical protein